MAKRRFGPIAPLRGVFDAGINHPDPSEWLIARTRRATSRETARLSSRNLRTLRNAETTRPARRALSRTISSEPLGAGRGS